ncbi:MAG: alanine racemase [Thermostichales cyanobacterium SZTDM-1c_bins_54]
MPCQLLTRRAWVEVSRGALLHNLALLNRYLTPATELWAVVKANAYGHDASLIAPLLQQAGVQGLCVATLEEGIRLRQQEISIPILVLEGLLSLPEWQLAQAWDLGVTLTDWEQLPWLEACPQVPVHLQVDTGLTRLGIPWQEVAGIWPRLARRCHSVYSHLATAEDPHHPAFRMQLERFAGVVQALVPRPRLHVGNSAVALLSPQIHYDALRVGLALYGISPVQPLPLRPVMQVCARILQIHEVEAGTGVSYGHRFVTQRPSRIATVGIGYADGLPRPLSGRIQGYLHGFGIPQVGTICMDLSMWDVTDVPVPVQVGDVVRLWGAQESACTWAEKLQTIPYEICCGFGERLPRVLI